MTAGRPPMVIVSVIDGDSTRNYFYTERTTCLVGRYAGCDLRIRDAARQVSRWHCRLEIDPPAVRLRDVGSSYGTFVDGKRLGRLTERRLADGDEIRLGGADGPLLRVTIPPPEEPIGPPADPPYATLLSTMLRTAAAGGRTLAAFRGLELVRELGRGGQGAVYLARDTSSGELMALKLLLAQITPDPNAIFGFTREFASIRALRHPHIVEFRGSGVSGDEFYFTCEYCAGGSVDRLVARRGGTLPIDEAASIILQVLDGLRYAHQATVPALRVSARATPSRGLVHRDIKPHNILLTAGGSPPVAKLADFGLAKAFDNAGLSGYTRTGAIGGTIPFMARTQLTNYKYAGPEVDVWAAAACLYWMLTGATPRDYPRGRDPVAVTLREPPVPMRERTPSMPSRLAAVIDAALVDTRDPPIATADRLAGALREAL